MPLPNRVDPFGNIITTSARGAWMGNRGQLHGKQKHILRPFKLKSWITCLLEFKNWKREVMSPNLYTELFFLDEATAFAAGHRPCCECRRKDYQLFKLCWLKGNPGYGFDEKVSINRIDQIIHAQRIDGNGNKVTFKENIQTLPNGTFIQLSDKPYLVTNGYIYHWTPFGYEGKISFPKSQKVKVLTPLSLVNAFRAGYKPILTTADDSEIGIQPS